MNGTTHDRIYFFEFCFFCPLCTVLGSASQPRRPRKVPLAPLQYTPARAWAGAAPPLIPEFVGGEGVIVRA